jgi:hypothetical protein
MAQTSTNDTVLKGHEAIESLPPDQLWGITSSTAVFRSAGSNIVKIAVNAGQAWGLNPSNQIFKWNGSSAWEPKPYPPGGFVSVAVGSDGLVLAIGPDYLGYQVFKWNGSSFDPVGSNIKTMAVNAGQAWGINPSNQIFKWNGSQDWEPKPYPPDGLVSVAVGSDGQVWAIGPAYAGNQVFKWNDSSAWDPKPSPTGGFVTMAVNAGEVWGIDPQNRVYAWNPALGTFDQQSPGPFVSIAVGSDGQVWATTPDHTASKWDRSKGFINTGLPFVTLAIGSNFPTAAKLSASASLATRSGS